MKKGHLNDRVGNSVRWTVMRQKKDSRLRILLC